MLASVLDLMQQDIELQSHSEVQKAFKRLAYLEPAVLERWVSQFKASLQWTHLDLGTQCLLFV